MFFLSLDTQKGIVSLFHCMHKVPLLSLLQSKMRCIAMNPAWFLYPGVDWEGEDRVKAALIGTLQEMRPRTGSTEPENNQTQVLMGSRAGLELCEVGSYSNPSLISCVREIPLLQGFHFYRKQFWDVFQAHTGHCWILLTEIEGAMLQKIEVPTRFSAVVFSTQFDLYSSFTGKRETVHQGTGKEAPNQSASYCR